MGFNSFLLKGKCKKNITIHGEVQARIEVKLYYEVIIMFKDVFFYRIHACKTLQNSIAEIKKAMVQGHTLFKHGQI